MLIMMIAAAAAQPPPVAETAAPPARRCDVVAGCSCQDLDTRYLRKRWGAARFCDAPPCFVLRRISKTGGSFLSNVLDRVVDRRRLAVVKDNVPLPCAYRSNGSLASSFFVGTMRNPCAFYASLAQYYPAQAFNEPFGGGAPWYQGETVPFRTFKPETNDSRRTWAREGELFAGSAAGPDPAVLRDYVAATRRGGLGYFSYHIWTSYLRHDCVDTDMTRTDPRARCASDTCTPDDFAREIATKLDPDALADCWVRTETLLVDLEACLRRYVARAPAAAGDVDFAALAALASETNDAAAVAMGLDDRKRPNTGHVDCGAYAGALDGVVRAADARLFDAFGYATCCGAASKRAY